MTRQVLEFTWWNDVYVYPWEVPCPNTQILALSVSDIIWIPTHGIRYNYLAQVKCQISNMENKNKTENWKYIYFLQTMFIKHLSVQIQKIVKLQEMNILYKHGGSLSPGSGIPCLIFDEVI